MKKTGFCLVFKNENENKAETVFCVIAINCFFVIAYCDIMLCETDRQDRPADPKRRRKKEI